MCLVSYIKGAGGEVILTSNRDEAPSRSADHIKKEDRLLAQILFPEDTKGGSWFVVSDKGDAAIILNGAFKNHERILPYRLSRGIMLKDFFDYADFSDFLYTFDFQNVEPFTMIVYQKMQLFELRWDGGVKHLEILDTKKCHIWSSCTLYTQEIQAKREKQFRTLLDEKAQVDAKSMKDIHVAGQVGDSENNFVMNREERVKTVSITQAKIKENVVSLEFENLLLETTHLQNMATGK